ncbi:MAG: HupE/UreJ family protein, partial [Vicinamibacterales bacterium]
MKKNAPLAIAAVMALLVSWGSAIPAAHDIPADVTVQVFVKPEGTRLRVLVRAPLQAMRDMDYPRPRAATNADLLDLARADATLRDAATLWISDYLDLYENGQALPAPKVTSVRAALQSDKSFASYDEALAHLAAPGLPPQTEFFWSQGLLDVYFDYPIHSDRSRLSIQPRLARLGIRTLTVLRYLPPEGGVRGFEFVGDPGLVQLDPTWSQTLFQFIRLGFERFVGGVEFLLFLIVLAVPLRRIRSLAVIVLAFVVAHSIALLSGALGFAPDVLWFPPLIDTVVALSIVYLALENIVLALQRQPQGALSPPRDPDVSAVSANSAVFSDSDVKRRWLATFGFGTAHGFAMAFALRPSLQLAGSHPLTAMVSFNVGIELALLLVLALLVAVLAV